MLLFLGFVMVEMPLSDPSVFPGSDLVIQLGVGAGMILAGLAGAFAFRSIYRQHQVFGSILSAILAFLLFCMGIACISITVASWEMPYLILGSLWGLIEMIVGYYLLFVQSLRNP